MKYIINYIERNKPKTYTGVVLDGGITHLTLLLNTSDGGQTIRRFKWSNIANYTKIN